MELYPGMAELMSALLRALTNKAALHLISHYANDPIFRHQGIKHPGFKLCLALRALLLGLVAFAQCARLAVHLSFLLRVVHLE